MEGLYGGEEVFNRQFSECSQAEKNDYFNPEDFSKLIGVNPPAEYDVTAFETNIYGPDSSHKYILTFRKHLTSEDRNRFEKQLTHNRFEKSENGKYIRRTDQEEVCLEVSKKELIVHWGSF